MLNESLQNRLMQINPSRDFDLMRQSLGFDSRVNVDRLATNLALDTYAVDGWERWGDSRRAIAEEQLLYTWTGIEVGPIDGLVGPQTRFARTAYQHFRQHGKLPEDRGDEVEDDPGSETHFPVDNQSALIRFYGQPGKGNSEVWKQRVKVPCPWSLRIAWDLRQRRTFLWAHQKNHEALARVLDKVETAYSLKEIKQLKLDIFSGDYYPRLKRGGRTWSTHAFLAAWDFADVYNQLRWDHRRALFARPEYKPWFIAWESEGFTSLGRERDYDWMHLQAANLR